MSEQFLSLAMAEARPGTGEFNIIAYRMATDEIVVLDLQREDIEPEPNRYVWDLCKITEVDDFVYSDDGIGNYTYKSFCSPKLVDQIVDIKNILDTRAKITIEEYREFKNRSKKFLCVLKPDAVYSTETCPESTSINARIQNHLQISLDGESCIILNKDYRWLNYWTFLYQNDYEALKEAQNRYLSYLNYGDKTIYLIIYKRNFLSSKGRITDYPWIAGMHLL